MKHFRPLSIVILVLILAGLACGGDDGGDTPTVKTATPESQAPAPTAPPAEQPAKLGDVVEKDGCTLSAITVEDPATPNEYLTELEEGTKMIGVEIVVGCTTCESISVNPLSASLVDNEGFTYQVELGGLENFEQIATVDIGPGEKVKGWVGFAIPEANTPAYLKWEVNLFTGPTLQVGLSE